MGASRRGGEVRRRGALLSVCLAALTVLLVQASGTTAAAAPTDRQATGTFLTATLDLDRTVLANAKTSTAQADSYARSLEQACPGVIASAPIRSTGGTPSESKLDARGRGELARQEDQLIDLRLQLADSLLAEVFGPDQEALLAYRRAVEPLRWSNPLVDSAVAHELASLRYLVEGPTEEVCTSLRAWSASGYRTVDAATRQAGRRFTTAVREILSYELTGTTTLEAMLERYESAAQRSLMRRIERLAIALSSMGYSSVGNGVGAALGFVEEPESAPQGTAIGHGLTAAGTSFVVRAERVPLVGCHYTIGVESKSASGLLPFAIDETTSSSGSSSGCPAHGRRAKPRVACEAKTVTVEYRTPAAARRARLAMSDGRTYTSAVIAVPRRLGGPAGFYYQAVPGAKSRPVSLTLLNSHGTAIAVVRLPRPSGCAPPPSPSTRPTRLAAVTDPDGSSFEVRGEDSSFRHRHTLHLEATSQQTEGEPLLSLAAPTSGQTASGQLQWNLSSSCEPTDTLVYGLLKTPADRVLARTTGGLAQLSTAAIPRRLHASGQLVYGAFAALPSELVLQAPDGSVLATVSLAAQGREAAEYCAGYDEAAPGASG